MVLAWPRFTRLQWLVHTASWIPLGVLVWDYFQGNLTVNPIQAITQRTGLIALTWLLFSLVCTPLNTLFAFRPALKLRRALGLYAFFYASLHFLTFFVLDYGANLTFIWLDLRDKPYILAGSLALIILIALAITSTRASMKTLGKRWKTLHSLVYPASMLVVIHYTWSVKADIRLPVVYGVCLAVLLLVRWPPLRRWVKKLGEGESLLPHKR
jgi:sulfoxide reductase heme-binding subunit YedZ